VRLRDPSLDDVTAAHAVVAARELTDLGLVDTSLDDLRDAWQRTEMDVAANVRLVEDATGQVVGFGVVEDLGASAFIHPEAEGRGAGTLLLNWLMERERQWPKKRHSQWTVSTNRSAAVLLTAHGYRLQRSSYRMAVALAGEIAGVPEVEGVTLRSLDLADLPVLHAMDQRAFADDPDYMPGTLTGFREEHLESHGSAPDLSLVALARDEVAGFLIARRRQPGSVGYVDILAVDPTHQGKGIGRSLLLRAFQGFAASGLNHAELGVSSVNQKALNLYKSAGMTPRFSIDIYERPI